MSYYSQSKYQQGSDLGFGIKGTSFLQRPQSSIQNKSQTQKQSRIQSALGGSRSNVNKPHNLPLSDYIRIREKVGIDPNDEIDNKTMDKRELKEKSMKRVQNWTDSRKQKDNQRFERFKKDEEERRRIDEEEKQFQLQEKKKIIDKANKQLYDRDDRVKQFYSKIAVVDALDQRKQQAELKKLMDQMEKKRDQLYFQQQQEYLQREDEKEQIKKEQLKKKRAQTAKVLKDQHENQKQRFIEHLQGQRIEGEIIKVRAQEMIEKEKIQELEKRERAKQLQEEIIRNNEELKILRQHLKEQEKEEEKQIEKHAQKKQLLADMRKKREKFIFEEKQREREKLIEKQAKQLAEIKAKEDARLNKDIKEAEIKAEQTEKIKQEKRKKLVKQFDESIKINMENKRIQSAKQKEEDKDYRDFWINKNKEIQNREKKDIQFYRDRCKELQEFHKQQALEKQKLREKEFELELEENEKNKRVHENGQLHFNSWAERMIHLQNQDGKDTKPLQKLLNQLKLPQP